MLFAQYMYIYFSLHNTFNKMSRKLRLRNINIMSLTDSRQLLSIICICRIKRSSKKRRDVPRRRVRRIAGNAIKN